MSDQWELPLDARKNGMKYPNYNHVISPSGNGYVIDDSKDNESVTCYHRSGTMWQMQPDGSMVIITKKNRYNVTFGDDNVMITGAHNVTVNGGASLKVEGDYDMTVHGNAKHTIKGNLETIVAGDMTTAVKGNQETVVGENQSIKSAGNTEILGKKTFVGGESGVALKAAGGSVEIEGDQINNTSSDLNHNGTNVGDSHTHSGVISGGDRTGDPK